MTVAAGLVGLVAIAIAGCRWLRVAQREHYIAGSCNRIGGVWARRRPPNALLATPLLSWGWILAVIFWEHLGSTPRSLIALVFAAGAGFFPLGMPLIGSPRLKFTRRALTTMGIVVVVAAVLAVAVGRLIGLLPAVVLVAVTMPLLTDLGLWIARPFETAAAQRHRKRAESKLGRVAPVVIAVTGSWGKTSVKNHIRDLLAGSAAVVASPASWNNMAGLSRTVNEHLADSTEVLVAEMGMYGPGEIRSLCEWVRPQIAVICAVGPMHMERVGSLPGIASAKAEIVENCAKAVLWVDDPLLEEHAMTRMPAGGEVWRVGTAHSNAHDNPKDDEDAIGCEPASATVVGGTEIGGEASGHGSDTTQAPGVEPAGRHASNGGGCRRQTDNAKSHDRPGLDVEVEDGPAGIRVWHMGELVGECGAAPGLHASNVGCGVAVCLAYGMSVLEIGKRLALLTPPKNRGSAAFSERGVYVLDNTFNSNPQGAAASLRRLHAEVSGRKVLATPGMVELGAVQYEENLKLAAEARRLGIEVLVIGWTNRKALHAGAGPGAVLVKNRQAAVEWVRANLREGDGVAWENDLPDHYP